MVLSPSPEGLVTLYRTIVADPPWRQPSGGPANGAGFAVAGGKPSTLPYSTMSLHDLARMPLGQRTEWDAHLYLWTTNHYIESAYWLARSQPQDA